MKSMIYILSLFAFVGSANANNQVCNENIQPSTPTINFIVNSDGTVTDKTVNLMWMRCTFGQGYKDDSCIGNPATLYWNEALSTAEQLEYASYNDWRLPNIKELATIIEDSCSSPAINLSVFPNTDNWAYWSSTVKSNTINSVFHLYLESGEMWFDQAYYQPYSMRLVRTVE
jgi:hypothetical protein